MGLDTWSKPKEEIKEPVIEETKEIEKPKELNDREQAEKELFDSYDESAYDEVIDIEW